KGLLPPRMTTAQRNGIIDPANGLIIFNTSSGCINVFKNGSWFETCGTLTGSIASLNCESASHSGMLTAGVAAGGVSSNVSYVNGNGGAYYGQSISSTG